MLSVARDEFAPEDPIVERLVAVLTAAARKARSPSDAHTAEYARRSYAYRTDGGDAAMPADGWRVAVERAQFRLRADATLGCCCSAPECVAARIAQRGAA